MSEDHTKAIAALVEISNVYKESNTALANELGKVHITLSATHLALVEAHEQILVLKHQLARYAEREKTMGWNQS